MSKKPWLAALLNILIPGLGYLYLGKRKLFGILLVVSGVAAYIWVINKPQVTELFGDPFINMMLLFYEVAFAIDAYQEAKGI